ncbi:hypothetical protein Cgig2_026993 [Carnegiea gigantea]|uniref:Uncharacterized protein n=1 Tax=Carnegiea gigantea TaxID=171969 RepID=A0A9Q1GJ23_9CARY|nr:hypothetical protein Cgig2_026993 [Carnegiea gigantea]
MDGPGAAAHDCANYEAHQRHLGPTGEASPPSPFSKDFQSLCRNFDLATVVQAAAYYELPELPQAIFYAMLLKAADKLGVLHGPRLRSLEVALTELHWGAFEFVDLRSTLRPPRPLPGDFEVLCPHFSLAEAEATVVDSGLPEIVLATFYAMLLNDMLELSDVHEYTAEKRRVIGFRSLDAHYGPSDPRSATLSSAGQCGGSQRPRGEFWVG